MGSGIVGPGSMSSQIGLQQAQESQMLQQVKSATGTDQTAKIEKGAREFEAMLLSGWLQQAEKSLATVPGTDEDDDGDSSGGQDTMTSLGVQSLAGSLAASGGIGIGAMIAKAMLAMAQKQQAANGQAPAPASGEEIHAVSHQIPLNSNRPSADRMAVSGKVPE